MDKVPCYNNDIVTQHFSMSDFFDAEEDLEDQYIDYLIDQLHTLAELET
tara:strand:+ start:88 stop:234 length:147 start_codon:yes stop_codon:yes gene_type:complete